MLLVIDVGNTNIVLGLYEGATLKHQFRVTTRRHGTRDEYGTLISQLLERRGIAVGDIEGSILASVVPQLNRSLMGAFKIYFGTEPLVVGPGIKTGMPILIDQPGEVGADRIVNSVAAWQRFKTAMVVVDFGTGTTFDAVNERGEYLGGAIAPGVDVSMDALFQRTAKLPRVEILKPAKAIGKNTVSALQSGLFYGYVGLVDELVTRISAELSAGGAPVNVLATGGLANSFEAVSKTVNEVDEFLTLDGLRLLYDLNRDDKNAKKKKNT